MACDAGRSTAAIILVIDDDVHFLDLIDEVLGYDGYHVLLCRDVVAGLAVLEEVHVALVILDLRFGGKESGWDVLEYLHLHPMLCTLPVLVCSAALDDLHAKRALWQARNISVLAKPFAIDELSQMVALTIGASIAGDDEEMPQETG